jgi:hypothetical protein
MIIVLSGSACIYESAAQPHPSKLGCSIAQEVTEVTAYFDVNAESLIQLF